MPFTGTFTIAAAAGFNVFTLTDTSDYTDEPKNTFSGRRVTLYTTDLSTLVPSDIITTYINFPYAGGDTITIDVMSRDYALNVVVDWISTAPQEGSVYQADLICGFESYNVNYEYGVIQALTARPSIQQDVNYWVNLGKVQNEIENSTQAVYYQEQVYAQAAMNRAANILSNQLTNF